MTAVTEKALSEKARDVMEAILTKPGQNAANIAEYLGVSVATVTGSLSTLKKREFVTVEDGILIATDNAKFEFGDSTPTPKAGEGTGLAITGTDDKKPDASLEVGTSTETLVEGEGIGAAAPEAEAGTKGKTKAKAEATPKTTGPTKAEKARAVFESMKDQPRKELMAALMAEDIGLSKNGANTYIYNMRKTAGMVTPRSAAAPAEPAAETKEDAAPTGESAAE